MNTDILKIVVEVPVGMRDCEKLRTNILAVRGIELVSYDHSKYKQWYPESSNVNTEEIGDGTVIHSHVWIGKEVKIGNRCRIQAFSFIPDGVTIEGDVFIGPRVTFTNDPELICGGKDFWKPTLVKRGAKIGAGACILAGVTIGEDAIVGMGSVVLKDVPKGQTVAGNPAKRVK